MVLGNDLKILTAIAAFQMCSTGVAVADAMISKAEAYGSQYHLMDHNGQCAVSLDGTTPSLVLSLAAPCGFVSQDGVEAQIYDTGKVVHIAMVAGPPVPADQISADSGFTAEQNCSHAGQPVMFDGQRLSLGEASIEPYMFCHNLGMDDLYFQDLMTSQK
ncbi:hypothetical protein [uncultured Litoreibacter sp.]|uniref:hypothetical protein n=1 Tax=uncultured Litoreibacter sp. TaxID=1392394 RepID=UPI002614DB3F|nr:hypothetical protein [uncultured Litoreibacter sp.]